MKKYEIDYGCGIAILYTPYQDVEDRFGELAGTCFGIRKSIMYVDVLSEEESNCADFERLEFCGDAYVWREDGARKMVEPSYMADDDWDMDYCEEICRRGKA